MKKTNVKKEMERANTTEKNDTPFLKQTPQKL